MTTRTRRRIVVLAVVAAFTAAAAAVRNTTGQQKVVPIGQAIRYDDFDFTVTSVRTSRAIGKQNAAGVYYVVSLNVGNRALRVPYQFDPQMVALIDSAGREYYHNATATAALLGAAPDPCASSLPPGASCTTDLVFDVPAGTRAPRLTLPGGAALGAFAFADALLGVSKAVQLP